MRQSSRLAGDKFIVLTRSRSFSKKSQFKIVFEGFTFVFLIAVRLTCLYILKPFLMVTPDLVYIASLSVLFLDNLC